MPASPQGDARQAPAQQNTQQSGQQQQGSSNALATTGQGSREQGEAEQKTNFDNHPINSRRTPVKMRRQPRTAAIRPSRGSGKKKQMHRG
jgi:hypothetical protein